MRLLLTSLVALLLTLPAHGRSGISDPCHRELVGNRRMEQHRRAILFGDLTFDRQRHECDLPPLSEQYETIEDYDREVVAKLDLPVTLFLFARYVGFRGCVWHVRGPTAKSTRELRRIRKHFDVADDRWSKALRWRRKHRCLDKLGPCEITVEDWMLPRGHRWATDMPMTAVIDTRRLPPTTDWVSFPALSKL